MAGTDVLSLSDQPPQACVPSSQLPRPPRTTVQLLSYSVTLESLNCDLCGTPKGSHYHYSLS